jgi:hypothetical protein
MAAQLSPKEFERYTKFIKNLDRQIRWFWPGFLILLLGGIGMVVVDWWCWKQAFRVLSEPGVAYHLRSASPTEIETYINLKTTRLEEGNLLCSLIIPNAFLGGIMIGTAIAFWLKRNYWRMLAALGRAHLGELAPPSESGPQASVPTTQA